MPTVLITGSIASGKSTILNRLKEEGYPTFSADRYVHYLYTLPEIRSILSRMFSASIIKNGKVDRPMLASLMFPRNQKTNELEQYIHPIVIDRFSTWIQNTSSPRFVESAQWEPFIKSGQIDKIWVLEPNKKRQFTILKNRFGFNGEIQNRIHESFHTIPPQIPHFTLDNSGSLDYTFKEVKKLI